MFAWLVFLVSYGLWRGRGSSSTDQFMLAGKTMPWYAMGLSIMATQASAITFISTTAQAYVDGMRFVQFYFGLPIAMVILSATAVPIFHRAKVYTAYEYLEHRFDAKTRLLVTIIFLISRGLQAGLALVGSGHRAVGGPRLAVPRDHPDHGRAGGALHDAGRDQGGHLGRCAADGGDHAGAGIGVWQSRFPCCRRMCRSSMR